MRETLFRQELARMNVVRYEEACKCADIVQEMWKRDADDDSSFQFTEKHTGRVLTHNEVYDRALRDAFGVLCERVETLYEVGP